MDIKLAAMGLNNLPFCRIRRAITLPVLAGAMLLPGLGVMAQDTAPGDVSGVWWITEYSPNLQIQGGGEIPYNEEGSASYA